MCCNPWGRKELDMTEQLNCTDISLCHLFYYYAVFFLALIFFVHHEIFFNDKQFLILFLNFT